MEIGTFLESWHLTSSALVCLELAIKTIFLKFSVKNIKQIKAEKSSFVIEITYTACSQVHLNLNFSIKLAIYAFSFCGKKGNVFHHENIYFVYS